MGRKRIHTKGNWPTRCYERRGKVYHVSPGGKWVPLGPASEPQTVYAALGAVLQNPAIANKTVFVRDIIDMYVAEELPHLSVSSQKTYGQYIKFLRHGVGDVPVQQLLPIHVKQYVQKRAESSPGRANAEKNLLERILDVGLSSCLIERNVARDLRWKAKTAKRGSKARVKVTDEQLKKLLDAAPEWLQVMVLLQVLTGARKSDVGTWTWDELDIADGSLTYVPRKTEKTGKVMSFKLSDQLLAVINRAKLLAGGKGKHVISQENGNPVIRGTVTSTYDKAWQRAMNKGLGIDRGDDGWFTPHDLRAKAITDTYLRTKSVAAAQNMGGHSTQTVTGRYLVDHVTVDANKLDDDLLATG